MAATAHIAPKLGNSSLRQSRRLSDATAVAKTWLAGIDLRVLGRDLLVRLATNGYGNQLRNYPEREVGR